MRRRAFALGAPVAAALPLGACGGSDIVDDLAADASRRPASAGCATTELELHRLPSPQYGWFDVPYGYVVFRSAAELEGFWYWYAARMWDASGELPVEPPPPIDFGRYAVAGVARSFGEGCSSLRIVRVCQAGDRVSIDYRVRHPSPNVLCTLSIEYHVELVRIPAAALEVGFRRVTAA